MIRQNFLISLAAKVLLAMILMTSVIVWPAGSAQAAGESQLRIFSYTCYDNYTINLEFQGRNCQLTGASNLTQVKGINQYGSTATWTPAYGSVSYQGYYSVNNWWWRAEHPIYVTQDGTTHTLRYGQAANNTWLNVGILKVYMNIAGRTSSGHKWEYSYHRSN